MEQEKEISLKNRLADVRRKKLRLLKEERYKYYVPIGKTEEFLDIFGSTKYLTTFYLGANGTGKTTVLANIVANLCFPFGSPYFQQKLFTDYPYRLKTIRIISNHNTLKETLIPTLKEWMPKGRYTMKSHGKNYDYHWTTDTGWEIFILTYDQPLDAFESGNVSIILFDEPPPHAIYKANVARTRNGGQIGILATPLIGSAWMYDEIVLKNSAYSTYVEVPVEAACKQHGVRGILEHEDIVKMLSQYSEEDILPRAFAKFQHLTGLVFKEFNKDVHVIKPFSIDRRNYTVIHSLDPHPRNEDAVTWLAVDREGNKYVIDELYGHYTTEELAYRIKQKDQEYGVERRLIDPSAMIKDQHTNLSLVDRLAKYGVGNYQPGSKKRSEAIRLMHDSFYYKREGDKFIVAPKIHIFDTCSRLKWEIEHWQYQEYVGKSAELKDRSEKPQDKDDHAIETVGRSLLDNPKFILPTPKMVENQNYMNKLGDPY